MIHDQANRLRQLVRNCTVADSPGGNARPVLVVVTSGKGGAGTTTTAVNLAVASAQTGWRTVLVDADCRGGDAAILCGIQERYTLADVQAGRRTVREALQPAPGGVQLLPGAWGLEQQRQHSPGGGGGDAGLRTAIQDPHADLLLGELPGTSRAHQSASNDYDIGLGHGTALL